MSNYGEYLNKVINSYELSRIQRKIDRYHRARQAIMNAIPKEWKAYNLINAGSISKGTAINTHFDFDLIVPFKHDRVDSITEMRDKLYHFFQRNEKQIEGLKGIRPQNVSVGLNFGITDRSFDFDVVPGLELSLGDYPVTGNLYLYPHIDENPKRVKTNIKKQLEYFNNSPAQVLNVVKLLKIWKYSDTNNKVKSFLLELMTIRALKEKMPGNLWEQLRYVLGFIEQKIETIHVSDPGNKNNNVADSMTPEEKKVLAKKLRKIIRKLDDEYKTGEKTTLKESFPMSKYA